MSTTISNWCVKGNRIQHCERVPENTKATAEVPVTVGKDYNGKSGTFAVRSFQLKSYQKYDGGFYRFIDTSNRTYNVSFNTHYKNPKYPDQCCKDEDELAIKLQNALNPPIPAAIPAPAAAAPAQISVIEAKN
jgi:hypothetical protein